ncbi:MAG: PilZ domain-containing protein [Acidobacteria bacterium]|nr:PilZ domain-containing protein [Acidobacteriota bacterium]
MDESAERRRYPRVKATVAVEIYSPDSPMSRTATSDISLCGCYIETMFTIPVGTKLELKFWVKDEPLTVTALVVTRFPQVGNGLEFIEMAPEARLKLADFISTCQKDTARS